MSSPDPIAPARVDELLGGAVPEGEREALVQGLVRELRAGPPPAPDAVRVRVRELAAQPARRRLPRRRVALAVAFVLLAVAALGAGLALRDAGDEVTMLGERPASSPNQFRFLPEDEEETEAAAEGAEPLSPQGDAAGTPLYGVFSASGGAPPITGRATDVDLMIELRLADADALSEAATDAMEITRELGGTVAASNVDTKGGKGKAELSLRVPVGRVEDALVRLSDLGIVTAQNVVTQDLQAGIDARDARIEALRRAIRIDELRLASATLTDERRLRIEIRLENRRSELRRLQRANAGDRREAATAELTLLLHTRPAPAAAPADDEEGAAGVVRDALQLLAAAALIALFAAIVAAPLVLLAFLVWLALRSRTRRIEARLLGREAPSPGRDAA